ncbi:MAG TPA: zinc-binding dehydrogenase [Steroidobacteraceae bacterium]|nr:zinc-binding dehydrogenase [Steroidobacteraceae bacterium]
MVRAYRKIVIDRLAGDFRGSTRIVETPWIEPGAGEVVVRNLHAGCNAVFDANLCRNTLRYVEVAPPFDMGIESVGEVVATGPGVTGFCVGDPVATSRLGTGYREYQVAEVARLYRVREPSPEILTLIPTGISALVALERVAEMRTGETVAVSAAAGALGHIVAQLAKRAGNRVIAITGSEAKAQRLRAFGFDRIVNYRAESLRDALAREYPRGLDIAYDSVGGELFDTLLDHLAMRGRLIVSGHTADFDRPPEDVPHPRVYHKLYWKSASVRAFLNPMFREFFDDAARRILDLYYAGELRVLVDPTPFVGLESVADAVEHVLSGRSSGKVVIRLAA